MISSGGVSLSLKICASSLCVQRYDSPFTPRFCLAGWNPRFCGMEARQTPAVRIWFRWRLNLLWSYLLASVRETETRTAACLQLTMTTLLVLCWFFLNSLFSADTTGLQQKTRRHVRRSKLTWEVWKNIHLVLLIRTRQKKKVILKLMLDEENQLNDGTAEEALADTQLMLPLTRCSVHI